MHNSAKSQITNQDNLAVTIRFANGSVGVIIYAAGGNRLLSKERIEIFGEGKIFVIDDFRTAEVYENGSRRRIKMPGKGHREEVECFINAIRLGLPAPVSFESICYTRRGQRFELLIRYKQGLLKTLGFLKMFAFCPANAESWVKKVNGDFSAEQLAAQARRFRRKTPRETRAIIQELVSSLLLL